MPNSVMTAGSTCPLRIWQIRLLWLPFALAFVAALSAGCGGGGTGADDTVPAATNHAPASAGATIHTTQNTPSLPIVPSVSDPDPGDALVITIETQPGNGSAAVSGNRLVYTPNAGFTGGDSFSFRATDSGGLLTLGTASVTVSPNSAPFATQAAIIGRIGRTGSPVSPYVADLDFPESFTFQILSVPAMGTATVVDNRLVYTQDLKPNLTGLDSFSYRATDSTGQSIDGIARVRVYRNLSKLLPPGLGLCAAASTVNPDGTLDLRTNAGTCAFYGEATTRLTPAGTPVTVKHVVHRPSDGSLSKAVVVLIAGGNLNANLSGGDPLTGSITSTGGNFLVRSAQLFAEAGYLTVAIDRPSDRADVQTEVDAYRVSVDHAVDILSVARLVNTDNLPLVLAGTSRGAMSVVANNLIASAIQISSPVTSGSGLCVGKAGVPNLQHAFVQRPAHVLWHDNDLCPITTPANSQVLYDALQSRLGAAATSHVATGGVQVTTASATVAPDVCGAFDYHGFLGIEPAVVAVETGQLDAFLSLLPANSLPRAAFATVQTAAGASKQINLSALTVDADGDSLSYAVSNPVTSLGGSVSVDGAFVTYTPPAGINSQTDYFVYVADDGKGGIRAAVVTVEVGI